MKEPYSLVCDNKFIKRALSVLSCSNFLLITKSKFNVLTKFLVKEGNNQNTFIVCILLELQFTFGRAQLPFHI